MDTPPGEAAETPKPFARTMLRVQVGAVCLVVLLAGAWLAPARDSDTRSAPPPEGPAPLLEERASGRTLDVLTGAIAGATTAGQPFAVRISAAPAGPPRPGDLPLSPADRRAGSGVLVGGGRILTHVDALPATSGIAVAAGDSRLTASLLAFEPETGLVLLAAPTAAGAPTLAPDAPATPALVVGVGRTAHAVAGLPAFVTAVDRERFAIGLGGGLAPGLPLFDPQGRLVAITGASGGGEAFAVAAALSRLAAQPAAAAAPVSFGISFQDRDGALAEAFGPAGAIVADVVDGAPAAAALDPGTLVLEIDGTATDTAEAALAALRAAADRRAPAALTVRRRGDRAPSRVAVSPAPAVELWRRARAAPAEGPAAGEVFAAAALGGRGVDPSARLLAIDGVAVRTEADARRALRGRPRTVVAVLRDATGRFVAALETPR